MRVDKFLKVSRIIKRRTIANEACDASRVAINDKIVKAGTEVKVGDIITIQFGTRETKVEVLSLKESVRKEDAVLMYKNL
ncbi:MAG: RNA-binding S4 domain-containing protein [Bacillota bacterium]